MWWALISIATTVFSLWRRKGARKKQIKLGKVIRITNSTPKRFKMVGRKIRVDYVYVEDVHLIIQDFLFNAHLRGGVLIRCLRFGIVL